MRTLGVIRMESPSGIRNRLERYADCKEAIESPVNDLIDCAVAAGWTHNEVATALINLAGELFPDLRTRGGGADAGAMLRH